MKQVRLLTKQEFEQGNWQQILELDKDEEMSFEDYINMELAIIHSENNQTIESITHSDDMERVMIIYSVTSNKSKV